MATSRRVPLNENISTYGGAGQGRDYTDLGTWEAATDLDLVTLQQSEVLECYDDADFDDAIFLSGAITNSSYFRVIRPAPGQGHDGTPNNGVSFITAVAQDIFSMAENFSQFQDLIAQLNNYGGNSDQSCFIFYTGWADNAAIGCIVKGAVGSHPNADPFGFYVAGIDTVVVNCLAQDVHFQGFAMRNDNGVADKVYAYNCTAVNCDGHGFEIDASNNNGVVLKNCLADGNTAGDYDGTTVQLDVTSTNNASGDATAPGTNNRINQTFTFVNAAADDFHLQETDAGAKDFGTDLSADSAYAFDDDIDGESRGDPWDIGFDEFPTAASATTSGVLESRIFGGLIVR